MLPCCVSSSALLLTIKFLLSHFLLAPFHGRLHFSWQFAYRHYEFTHIASILQGFKQLICVSKVAQLIEQANVCVITGTQPTKWVKPFMVHRRVYSRDKLSLWIRRENIEQLQKVMKPIFQYISQHQVYTVIHGFWLMFLTDLNWLKRTNVSNYSVLLHALFNVCK